MCVYIESEKIGSWYVEFKGREIGAKSKLDDWFCSLYRINKGSEFPAVFFFLFFFLITTLSLSQHLQHAYCQRRQGGALHRPRKGLQYVFSLSSRPLLLNTHTSNYLPNRHLLAIASKRNYYYSTQLNSTKTQRSSFLFLRTTLLAFDEFMDLCFNFGIELEEDVRTFWPGKKSNLLAMGGVLFPADQLSSHTSTTMPCVTGLFSAGLSLN